MLGSLTVFANDWSLGPPALVCPMILLLLFGPFILLAIAAYSLISADTLPRVFTIVMVVGALLLTYLLYRAGLPFSQLRGFWRLWWFAGCASVLSVPAVLFLESVKRGWWRRISR